ncbi:K+ transport system, NAD-binding component [Aequorivita sublithincola DSM 14238]|uniref:K+ transport system, NAD-binding component n=1 Tax=Aequorivita sublithincola (strain DSM 14238 / LMG 21431 / ACAM 643 / 9-3) TaxID=746697 RepID=I3YRK9_AEQSU|nr:TrkA C-terminal domain-containing protein [Aequorivita sublithincola]AFL79627.1 K+ transport system, NAD-binding component [Aequorivita sublithincola DSM 14238]
MIAAITLFLVVALSALITKIATIALTYTGLSTQSARFQARSAYTGAGFTTSESEKIMNHPVRRKIIFNLMLIGNAGIVTVMSSLILTFVLPDTLSSKLYGLGIVVVGLSLIYWAIKSKWVDRGLSKLIDRMLKKYTDLEIQDYAAVLHLKDDYKISEKRIGENDWLANKTLKDLELRKEGITILGIDRDNEDYFGSPMGDFKLLPNDVVTVYGKAEGIHSIYARKKDFTAEMQHNIYVQKETKRKEEQQQSKLEDQ